MSIWLHSSFELRLTADYAELTDISAAQAEECYSQASEFLQRVRDFLNNSEQS